MASRQRPTIPISIEKATNHQGATQYPQDIDQFITEQLAKGNISGPYTEKPLGENFTTSPLSTRKK